MHMTVDLLSILFHHLVFRSLGFSISLLAFPVGVCGFGICFSSSAFLRFYFLNVPYVLRNVGTESLLLGFQPALWNVNVSYSRTQHYGSSGDRTKGPLHTESDALSERHCAPRFIMLERFVPVSPSSAP